MDLKNLHCFYLTGKSKTNPFLIFLLCFVETKSHCCGTHTVFFPSVFYFCTWPDKVWVKCCIWSFWCKSWPYTGLARSVSVNPKITLLPCSFNSNLCMLKQGSRILPTSVFSIERFPELCLHFCKEAKLRLKPKKWHVGKERKKKKL